MKRLRSELDLLRRFMLALCVYREARGETALGQALVAQVIINRSRDARKRWPRTIAGVITQPKQFSSFNAKDPNVTVFPAEGEYAWMQCMSSAQRALEAKPPLTKANHYHSKSVKPPWADPVKMTETEGHHIFYCL